MKNANLGFCFFEKDPLREPFSVFREDKHKLSPQEQ